MRSRLAAATDAYAEEQEIADELTGAVMRQILLVSAPSTGPAGGLGAEFQRAGDEASALIQRYLFRDLSPGERLQLEQVKEAHQRLEVGASRAAATAAGGDAEAAEASTSELLEDATALHEALDGFLEMREAGLESLRSRQNAASNALYLGGAGFAALILLGSVYLGRFLQLRVTEPLAALTEAARRIGEGDLTARVPTDHDREFAGVARAFNQMAEDLAGVQEDLESHNRQLARALENVRKAQAELIESEKLAAMGRMTAGLAHELNNPLAGVLGYGELLEERLGRDGDPGARALHDELVVPIVQEAVRARQLVRNFVQFARGSGEELGPVRVREALDVVVGLQGFAFEREGLALEAEDVPDVWVRAERQALQEVFLNLVRNAHDAMRDAGRGSLVIRGSLDDGTLLLAFEDQGPGLDNPQRLFEPFYTTKPVGQGTGLGLATVHHAMEAFGG
ncbi:MAG TPA: ATP-binding protein, partial [Longimicrobiales bacterium]|nr:ATP-binding protein [Longimicrobiales bacterium]